MISRDPEVLIVGAGMGGIAMAVQLKRQLGLENIQILEKAQELGGSWNLSRYPGVGCDIPMISYSYSFAQRFWPNQWAPGQEIREYFGKVAKDFGVADKIEYRIQFVKAEWREEANKWYWEARDLKDGSMINGTCKILISAIGGLTLPRESNIKGKDRFQGKIVHTGAWTDTDLTDKDVVVLGNGCSGTQVVTAIAPTAKSVTQFGRSKHWYLPRDKVDWLSKGWILRNSPLAQDLMRKFLFFVLDAGFGLFRTIDGTKRRKQLQDLSRSYIQRKAPEEYWDVLTPDFPIGAKRRIFSAGYLETLNLPHVKLHPEDAVECTEHGVKRANGEIVKADVIIEATGFQVQSLQNTTAIGRNGEALEQHWADGASNYLSTFFAGFPNFGMILGPNASTGHHAVTFHTECQINMMIRVFKDVLRGRADAVSVTAEAEREHYSWLRRKMKDLVFESSWEGNENSRGWYTDDKGRCNTAFPASQLRFWWMTYWIRWNAFTFKNRRRSLLSILSKSAVAIGLVAILFRSYKTGQLPFLKR